VRQVFLPRNLDEVWDAWDRWPAAALYAGGTDLLVRLRAGLVDPPALICVERVEALKEVRDEGEAIFVGAGATHAELINNQTIHTCFPVLVQALEVLAGPPVRHMGTIGGNVVNASPAGDTLPPLTVLNARVEVQSKTGSHRVPLSRFIIGPGRVLLKPGELVAGLWIKKLTGPWLHHYEKVGLRKAQACAVASLAAVVKTDANGVVEEARMAWGSVGPTVMACPKAEEALKGRTLSMETLRHVQPFVQEVISPIDDIRASASYRRRVAGSLLLRLCLLRRS
jgi:CO/xanthine dehydrogenase FAD-binding subunit